MQKAVRVILYGNSLFLNGIATSLEGAPALEIVRVQPETAIASLGREELCDSLLAFDIHEVPPELMLTLFKETSNATLLALDPEGDRLIVLSSEPARVATTDDLLQVIRFYGLGSPADDGKPINAGSNNDSVEKVISVEKKARR